MKHISCSHCRRGHIENKKAFQYDAYRLLADRIHFVSHVRGGGGEYPLDIPTPPLTYPPLQGRDLVPDIPPERTWYHGTHPCGQADK